jgi:hypothetical protein
MLLGTQRKAVLLEQQREYDRIPATQQSIIQAGMDRLSGLLNCWTVMEGLRTWRTLKFEFGLFIGCTISLYSVFA